MNRSWAAVGLLICIRANWINAIARGINSDAKPTGCACCVCLYYVSLPVILFICLIPVSFAFINFICSCCRVASIVYRISQPSLSIAYCISRGVLDFCAQKLRQKNLIKVNCNVCSVFPTRRLCPSPGCPFGCVPSERIKTLSEHESLTVLQSRLSDMRAAAAAAAPPGCNWRFMSRGTLHFPFSICHFPFPYTRVISVDYTTLCKHNLEAGYNFKQLWFACT